MSKNIRISVVLVITLGCALTVALIQRLNESDHVNSVAHRIADFDLLPGYRTDYVVEMLDYTIAAYKSDDEQGHLAFLQAPSGIIPQDQVIAGYIINDQSKTIWRDETILLVEKRTIRNKPATLTISDRTNAEEQRYRTLNMVFEGREGSALLVINQPVAQWDEDTIEAFVASIH